MSRWESRIPEIKKLLDEGKDYGEIAEILGLSRSGFRALLCRLRKDGLLPAADGSDTTNESPPEPVDYVKSMEINADGTYRSDRPLWMTLDQVKDQQYIMRAHGFPPDEWELVNVKNNIWNTNDKIHGIQTLYGSKITVKPRTSGWTFEQLLEAIKADVKPVHIEASPVSAEHNRMLEISLFDMHFGNNDYEYYRETQQEIVDILSSKNWREVLFVIGQDMLHHDNFKSSTSNGTVIANADMKQAWEDVERFYFPLIELAAKRSNKNVHIIYSKGNHDESMSFAFVKELMQRYPELIFDDRIQERKVHVYGQNFIGITHGDKARKVLAQLFPAEFPFEWAKTTCREIHAGDLHREDMKGIDEWGVMFRTLGTRNKTDQWHEDKGFTTAHKRFMLFEYDIEELKHIHYV